MSKGRCRKGRIGERAGKSRRSRGHDLRNLNLRALEDADDFHQAGVTSMRDTLAFRKSDRRKMAVIVMQPAKDLTGILYRSRELNDFIRSFLLDAGSIHSRVHVDEQANGASFPRLDVLAAFNKRRHINVGKLLRDFSHAASISAEHWISNQYVRSAG